jgi:hypothetical protein
MYHTMHPTPKLFILFRSVSRSLHTPVRPFTDPWRRTIKTILICEGEDQGRKTVPFFPGQEERNKLPTEKSGCGAGMSLEVKELAVVGDLKQFDDMLREHGEKRNLLELSKWRGISRLVNKFSGQGLRYGQRKSERNG